ncbi:MAG: HD domain-containing protein [Bacteroidales bacterium]|jgi:exopolyphosphatase/pppGpp-phosphohydrolase|nr:HD domain-containing protein [Bacteroidales bacterium]
MDFKGAKDYILTRLQNELTPSLCYHSIEHTKDVLEASHHFATLEKLNEHSQALLATAALYHDSGIIVQYRDHEAVSVSLAREILPQFGYLHEEIEEVADLIMMTRLPQQAISLPEQILCDADLDYLGRDDFFIHSFQLQLEWKNAGILETNLEEWLELQVKFLSEHRYFTHSANSLRKEKKLYNLDQIRRILKSKS